MVFFPEISHCLGGMISAVYIPYAALTFFDGISERMFTMRIQPVLSMKQLIKAASRGSAIAGIDNPG